MEKRGNGKRHSFALKCKLIEARKKKENACLLYVFSHKCIIIFHGAFSLCVIERDV